MRRTRGFREGVEGEIPLNDHLFSRKFIEEHKQTCRRIARGALGR
jgi:hypothetical protein